MKTINERISACIEDSGLTKTAFADKINVSQSFVSRLASGDKIPSDRTIADICEKFDISEKWLRTGEGPMHIEIDKDEQFDKLCLEIQLSSDEFIKDIMRKYWGLDESGKEIVRQMLSGLSDK